MRICCYTDTYFPLVGGAEMVLHNLASRLAQWGDHVHILAPKARGLDNALESPYLVHRYGKPSSKRFLVRQVLPHLIWLHLRYGFDLLHCHSGYPPAYVGATFKRMFNIPMVVRPHGSDVVPGGRIRKHPRLEGRLSRALACADAVVAQGQYLKNVILSLGVEENRVHTIHNGVNLHTFGKWERFSHPRPYILALGNLIPRKGFDILLRAYAAVPHPGRDLLIAGPGPEENALRSLAGDLGLGERVRFLGFVDGQDKVNLYRCAEFFVCPSRKEPFANVILEAMAAGLPVVASGVDGNKELVRHGKNGILFPPGDVDALKQSLQDMTGNAELVRRLRAEVPDFVKSFDWPEVAKHYRELYLSLQSHRAKSPPKGS
jgi:glycosyltransferase involved in cell wall biosynthesis